MERKRLFGICLMVGFISTGFIAPPLGAAHENAVNHSHMNLTCNSEKEDAATSGEYAVTQMVLTCSGCKTDCFGDQDKIMEKTNEPSGWEEDIFFDKYSY